MEKKMEDATNRKMHTSDAKVASKDVDVYQYDYLIGMYGCMYAS